MPNIGQHSEAARTVSGNYG